MTGEEYRQFGFAFLIEVIWIVMAFFGTFKTDRFLNTFWGKTIWRNTPRNGVRIANGIFLLAGLMFILFEIVQLSNGTFKWRGNPKTYSFSDFFK
jgi:hypothetical protein